MARRRIAFVTGANRGIGFATVRQLCRRFDGMVFLTARSAKTGETAVRRLNRLGAFPSFHQLDIASRPSRERFAAFLGERYGGVDAVVNNAAVRHAANSTLGADLRVRHTLHVNFYSLLLLCNALFPLLRRHARVVHVSAACGNLHSVPAGPLRDTLLRRDLTASAILRLLDRYKDGAIGGGDDSAYCLSKAAVTALTFVHARYFERLRPRDDIVVNCINPGTASTMMTNYAGSRSPNDSAANIVTLATLPHRVESPVGQYLWHDLSVVDWNGTIPDY